MPPIKDPSTSLLCSSMRGLITLSPPLFRSPVHSSGAGVPGREPLLPFVPGLFWNVCYSLGSCFRALRGRERVMDCSFFFSGCFVASRYQDKRMRGSEWFVTVRCTEIDFGLKKQNKKETRVRTVDETFSHSGVWFVSTSDEGRRGIKLCTEKHKHKPASAHTQTRDELN